MEVTEICPLTEDAVAKLLADREAEAPNSSAGERRKVARWPFPGTAELWIPQENDIDRYVLATSLNLSLHGVGIRCEEPLAPGLELDIAIHEPEMSFHGRAVARHCTEIEDEYLIGLQFLFSST